MASSLCVSYSAGRAPRVLTSCGVAVALTLAAGTAVAQVNIERLRMGMPRDGNAGSIEASFTGRTGSTEGITAGALAQAQVVRRAHWLFAHGSGDYTRWGGKTSIARSFIHLRYAYRLHPRVSAELFGQEQTDRIRLLRLRQVGGAGPRLVFFNDPDFQLSAGTAWMLEHELIRVEGDSPDDPATLSHRWSNYLSAVWVDASGVSFSNVLYVQPRFDRIHDNRILFESSLVIDLGKRIATRVGISVRRDSDPPTGVPPVDAEVKNSIVVKF